MQILFDKAVTHMRAQGNPWGSAISSRPWAYINKLNPCERCARACLINGFYDDLGLTKYAKNTFGNNGINILICRQHNLKHTAEIDGLLTSLQAVFEHILPHKWEQHFRYIAEEHGLKYTALSKQPETIY